MQILFRQAMPQDSAALLIHLKTVGSETDNLTFGKEGFRISEEREARFINRFIKNEDEIMLVAMDGESVTLNAGESLMVKGAQNAKLIVSASQDAAFMIAEVQI